MSDKDVKSEAPGRDVKSEATDKDVISEAKGKEVKSEASGTGKDIKKEMLEVGNIPPNGRK